MTSPFQPNSLVAAYLRDSGGDEQDLSVEQQEASIRAWCDENHVRLSRLFCDRARPGSTTVGRLEFERLITHFHSSPPEAGVILWKYSRLARDIDSAMLFKIDFRKRGFILHSMRDNIPEGINGKLVEFIIDWTNENYLKDLSEDVKRGLNHLVKEYGGIPGVPPRGFKREPVTLGSRRDGSPHIVHRWVQDPATADLCRLAWQMRASGKSLGEIFHAIPLYSSINCWSTFFENRLYLGELCFGSQVIPNYVPAIVDQATWDKVQQIRRSHIKGSRFDTDQHPRRISSRYLLSGMIYCDRCKSPMNGDVRKARGRIYEFYTCSRKHRQRNCDAPDIRRKTIETAVLAEISNQVLEMENIQKLVADSGGVDDLKARIRILEGNRLAAQRQMDHLVDAIAERGHSTALIGRLDELETDISDLDIQLGKLRSAEANYHRLDPAQLAETIAAMKLSLQGNDFKLLRAVLKTFIYRVWVDRQDLKILGRIEFTLPFDCGYIQPHSGGAFYSIFVSITKFI